MSAPEPYWSDDRVQLYLGKCEKVLPGLPAESVDAIVCDPPYGLEFMGKEWDSFKDAPRRVPGTGGREAPFAHHAVDLSPQRNHAYQDWCQAWAAECLRVLKPGGYMLAFGGTRTYHRLTCAIEDAGFEIRDSLHWIYGSGFPKSLDVSKAIDKAAGHIGHPIAELKERLREAFNQSGKTRSAVDAECGFRAANYLTLPGDGKRPDPWVNVLPSPEKWQVMKTVLGYGDDLDDLFASARREVIGQGYRVRRESTVQVAGLSDGEYDITAPATGDAARWEGWGTALKPAHEPVIWAQKPFNPVSLDWRLVADVHHALSGLLWLSLSPAKRAEPSSPSRNHEPSAAGCASARVSAALGISPGQSGGTGTFSSQALESTCLSIAGSWSAILAALSDQTRTSTTSTASSMTTALRTLNSLLAPITSPTTMPSCECLLAGSSSNARNAEHGSSAEWASWLGILSRSAPETATEGIALAAASVLASIAESLSGAPEAENSAQQPATTSTGRLTGDGIPSRTDQSGSPAHEPIVVARKPLAGTVVQNVLTHGTGALNIDGCRVDLAGEIWGGNEENAHGNYSGKVFGEFGKQYAKPSNPDGRWPPNVLLGPDAAEELDRQSGISKSSGGVNGGKLGVRVYGAFENEVIGANAGGLGDSGGASRFFPVFRYEAKAGSGERPQMADGTAHPTVKPVDLMAWLVRLVTPPGGLVLDPFAGTGTTAEACLIEGFRCLLIEKDPRYAELIRARLRKPVQPVLFGGEVA